MPKKKSKKTKSAKRGVPRRRKGESLIAYHDRLAALILEANEEGDHELSERLQRKAGRLARDHEQVARKPRKGKRPRSGPGTFPWYECVEEQTKRAKGAPHHLPSAEARKRANQICGRIRATSRETYPTYWNVREARANPESNGKPYAGVALDGGPRLRPHRDLVVVVDRGGTVLDLFPILGKHSFSEFDSKYPGIPIIGPFQVLASSVREIQRRVQRGTPPVEIR